MIICPLAAQHQLLAGPTGGENRRLSIRSWHASWPGAEAAARTAMLTTPISTHLPRGNI
jgi:hypothetical protein